MKKKLLKLCSVVLIISMVLGNVISVSADTNSAETTGMTFSSTLKGVVANPFESGIKTLEATISLPETLPEGVANYEGVIMGSYGEPGVLPSMSFSINTTGYAFLFYHYKDTEGVTQTIRLFINKSLKTGEPMHVAFVLEDDSETGFTNVSGYVNGDNVGFAPSSTYPDGKLPISITFPTNKFCVGGDHRTGNASYFKGEIYSIAAYSDMRSQDEIKNNMSSVDAADAGLMAYYDLTTVNNSTTQVNNTSVNDTTNKYSLNLIETWMDERRPALDQDNIAYSIALVGDTQIATEYDVMNDQANENGVVAGIYQWLLENKEEKNIQFVVGLGDIVQSEGTYALNQKTDNAAVVKTDEVKKAEWDYALSQIKTLNDEIPYSLIRGNHDPQAEYIEYVTQETYGKDIDGALDETMLNTWQELVVGDIKYLIMSLDLGASDTELKWAEDVIKTHPNHNVIITTHAYLNDDGTTLDANDAYHPDQYNTTGSKYPDATHNRNNGDEMWDNYFSKYDNIVMIVSGHIGSDDIIMSQAEGVNGNKVAQLLVDPQDLDFNLAKLTNANPESPTGMVCLLNFSADGKTVQVEQYSTNREQWYMSTSQFTFEMDVVEDANQKLLFNTQQMEVANGVRPFSYDNSHCATVQSQIILSAGYTNVISWCAPSDGLLKLTDMSVGFHSSQSTGLNASGVSREVEFAITDENGKILSNRGSVLTLNSTQTSVNNMSIELYEMKAGEKIHFVFHGNAVNTNLIICQPQMKFSSDMGNTWSDVCKTRSGYVVPWPASASFTASSYEQGMGGFYYEYSRSYEMVECREPEYLHVEAYEMKDGRSENAGFPYMYKNYSCMTAHNQIIATAGHTNIIAYQATDDGEIFVDDMQVWIANYNTTGRKISFAVIDSNGKILSNNGRLYITDTTYTNDADAIENAENIIVSKVSIKKGERIYFVFHSISGSVNSIRCNAKILFCKSGETQWSQVNDNSKNPSTMSLYSKDNYINASTNNTVVPTQGFGNFYYMYSLENTSNPSGVTIGTEKEDKVTVYEKVVSGKSYVDKYVVNADASGSVTSYIDIDMLNIKKQTKVNEKNEALTDIRFIASVDNLSYQKVGFLFTKDEAVANDATQFTATSGKVKESANRPTTKVYTKIKEADIYRKASEIYAEDGCNTAYGFAFEMKKIPANDGTIYVRAYVLLEDGQTYVYGEPRAINVTAAGTVN